VGIVFNTVAASDTIELKNGSASIGKIIFGATPPTQPFFVQYGTRVDSAIVTFVRAKGSNVTVIYRRGY